METVLLIGWLVAAAIYILFMYKGGLSSLIGYATVGIPIGLISLVLSLTPLFLVVVIILNGTNFLADTVPAMSTTTLLKYEDGSAKIPTNYQPFELLLAVVLAALGMLSFLVGKKLVQLFWDVPQTILMPLVGILTAGLMTGLFGLFPDRSIAKVVVSNVFDASYNLSWLLVFAVISFAYGIVCTRLKTNRL